MKARRVQLSKLCLRAILDPNDDVRYFWELSRWLQVVHAFHRSDALVIEKETLRPSTQSLEPPEEKRRLRAEFRGARDESLAMAGDLYRKYQGQLDSELEDDEVRVLEALASRIGSPSAPSSGMLAADLQLNQQRVIYYLERLTSMQYVYTGFSIYGHTACSLDTKGRVYLAERGLI